MANGALSTKLNNMNCLRSALLSHLQCFSFSWVLSGCWIAFGIFSLLAHFWTLNCRKRKTASLRNCSATSIVTFAQGSRRPRQIRCLMQMDYDCCCFNCQNLQIKWRYKCLEQNIGYRTKILHLSKIIQVTVVCPKHSTTHAVSSEGFQVLQIHRCSAVWKSRLQVSIGDPDF